MSDSISERATLKDGENQNNVDDNKEEWDVVTITGSSHSYEEGDIGENTAADYIAGAHPSREPAKSQEHTSAVGPTTNTAD